MMLFLKLRKLIESWNLCCTSFSADWLRKNREFTFKEEVLDLIYYLKPHTPPLSVPPSSPRIRSRGNKNIISNGILGPVAENENIDLTCDTVGGKGY